MENANSTWLDVVMNYFPLFVALIECVASKKKDNILLSLHQSGIQSCDPIVNCANKGVQIGFCNIPKALNKINIRNKKEPLVICCSRFNVFGKSTMQMLMVQI